MRAYFLLIGSFSLWFPASLLFGQGEPQRAVDPMPGATVAPATDIQQRLENIERLLNELKFGSQDSAQSAVAAPPTERQDVEGFPGIRQEVGNAFRNEPRRESAQNKVNDAVVNGYTRSPAQRLNSQSVILTPLPVVEPVRDEQSGVPFEPINILPGPQDPNDLQNQPAIGSSSLRTYRLTPFWSAAPGQAALLQTSERLAPSAVRGVAEAEPDPKATPVVQLGLQARPGIFYDSGNNDGSKVFNPATIALYESTKAHGNGRIWFYNQGNPTGQNGFLIPVRPQVAVQSADQGYGLAAVNLDALSTTGTDFFVRTAALRYVTPEAQWGMAFGEMETLFGDLGSAAGTTITGSLPVGTVSSVNGDNLAYVGVAQLRLMRYLYNVWNCGDVLETSISMENPRALTDGYIIDNGARPVDSVVLNRYPTIAGRIRYQGANEFNSFQVAALMIPMGFDDSTNFREDFETGYGFSTNLRVDLGGDGRRHTAYLGAVGGKGIAGYIYGHVPGAIIDWTTDRIDVVSNIGAYAAYGHVFGIREDGSYWSSNLMGGMVQAGETIPGQNRQLYQLGANLLWNKINPAISVGLEYQYGSRLVQDGPAIIDNRGENHRLMLVVQFSTTNALTKAGGRSAAVQAAAPSFSAAANAVTADTVTPTRSGAPLPVLSNLRF